MKKAVGILVALALAAQVAAQQVPPPTSPAKLTQPATGVNMPPAYVKTVARMAYVWGWPMVKPNETQYFYTDDDSWRQGEHCSLLRETAAHCPDFEDMT